MLITLYRYDPFRIIVQWPRFIKTHRLVSRSPLPGDAAERGTQGRRAATWPIGRSSRRPPAAHQGGLLGLRLEHVAAHAGVGKATIYRRWRSKEQLAQALLADLAAPHIAIDETGDTRDEMLAAVMNPCGPSPSPTSAGHRALLSQIAANPALGDPFRATVVQARRDEIGRMIARGIERGDLCPDADADVATELLVGPVYFRFMFGGELNRAFAERVVDNVMRGYAASDNPPTESRPDRPPLDEVQSGGPDAGPSRTPRCRP